MTVPKKAAALAAGFVSAFALSAGVPSLLAQGPRSSDPATLVVEDATVDWIQRSNVAALREGVIDKMELEIGDEVARGKPIGYLHAEMAQLAVRKAEVAFKSEGPKAKAQAQKEFSAAVVALNIRLEKRIKGSVSQEEQRKAEAELKVAQASIVEAEEKTKLDDAEVQIAKRAFDEHTIRAPFDGMVIEVMKHEGESVRANEAVVKLGNLGRLRAYAYVPLEFAYRVKEGQVVELQPRLIGERNNPLPIEQKRFRGKITFVDPQIQPVAETAVRIYAEFENTKENELRPGLKASMTIYLNSDAGTGTPAPAVGARTGGPGGVGR
jgi:RND family efflux transporter MFP subunit